jgi:tetratricopeptide (TPR) repeat protein
MSALSRVSAWLPVGLMAAAVAAAPGLAHAEWRKAETRHFIVYGEGFERELRNDAIGLERVDQLMRAYFALPEVDGGRKLPIYVVRTRRDLAVVAPHLSAATAGVYSAHFRDVRAVAIRGDGDEVLRHEYAHHFMYRNFPGAYPSWFREGFAEFFMTATVASNGHATVGRSSQMRVRTLNNIRWLPSEQVLTGRYVREPESDAVFYAQSWLLTHWTLTDPDRRRRMQAYLADTARGMTHEAALRTHFDMDFRQLDQSLRAYFNAGPRYAEMELGVTEPSLTVSPLPDSADDVLLIDLNARDGGPVSQGPDVLARARAAAARHPNDALALMMLARVELRWGDPAAAERVIQPLLDADPANTELLLLMSDARITAGDKLTDPEARERLYRQARGFLARAYAADPGDNRVYQNIAYSRRFTADYPTENDVELWRRAVALAPEVSSNRAVTAEAMLGHGLVDEAEQVILPIANDPHGGEVPERLQRILDRIAEVRAGATGTAPAAPAS